MSSQQQGSDQWTEPAKGGGTPIATGYALVEDGGEYVLEASTYPDAELVDWHAAGLEYEMLITSDPYVIVDVGGGVLTPAASGTAAAILVDDDGGLVASTDLTLDEAGAYYAAANGSIVAARFYAPRKRFVGVRSVIRAFP